jgi:hypothetical protein
MTNSSQTAPLFAEEGPYEKRKRLEENKHMIMDSSGT